MSNSYLTKFGTGQTVSKKQMRIWCQRPGTVDEHGKIQYFTEQSHKKECDVNEIIKKYDKTGLITHIQKIEAKFGDLTGYEYKTMQDILSGAKSMFEELPAKIRKEFDNNPQYLIEFMEKEENREKAIELGLINKETPEDKDGLGEHIKEEQKQIELKRIEKIKEDGKEQQLLNSQKLSE